MSVSIQDTAVMFRALLACFARPGTVMHVGGVSAVRDLAAAEDRVVLSLAMTLLDPEVGHCFEREDALAETVRQLTLSRRADPETADYVFVRATGGRADAQPWIRRAKPGTLEHPEESATLFIEAGELVEQPEREAALLLSGPGIDQIKGCRIGGVSPSWIQERERKNGEYPLGIDLVFYTAAGHILALPRTTTVKEGSPSWDTSR